MSRSVEKWVGRTDDAMPPPRVRVRIFDAHGGICHRTGRKIMAGEKWALDHIIAIINGGTNDEDNLAPILDTEHVEKTREDVARKSKIARTRKRHLGVRPKHHIIAGSKASGWKKPLNGPGYRRDE